jgi:hydrogen peroxide-dependent heme synthase
VTEDTTYAYYPVFSGFGQRYQPEPPQELMVQEFEDVLKRHAEAVSIRGIYDCTAFRPHETLMMWWVAHSPDDVQRLLTELQRTTLGRQLFLTHAFMGVHRPPEFNPQHQPAFLRGEPPRKYICVYPFVRTPEWYLLPAEERAALLKEHGEIGREFPDVLPNTTSAFGLGDYEWILAFEADELHRIVDCIRRLRDSDSRRYVKKETPFVVGVRKELRQAISDLA